MNIKEEEIKKKLFNYGLKAFRNHDFYDAHEYWEDLWSDYRLTDAKFIQGLIQLAVGYFHISNLNINGARGLFKKCVPKLIEYKPIYRNIDIDLILNSIDQTLEYLDKNDISEFDWTLVPKI
tara:strand:+ start:1666 stop:2031 length:366 start_codon:yes stop_codon:yes gene_type:complete